MITRSRGGQSAKPATQADEPSNLLSDDPTSPAAERANKVPVTTARRDRQLKPQDEDALLALGGQLDILDIAAGLGRGGHRHSFFGEW